MKTLRISIAALMLFAVPALVRGAEGDPGKIFTFGAGARSLAMGQAYTAIARDATATYWNPAGLGALRQHNATFLHAKLFEGAAYDYLGYGGLQAGDGNLGAFLIRTAVDGGQRRDASNRVTGSFDYEETALGFGYGQVLSRLPTLGLGVNGKVLGRDLGGTSSQLYGLDLAAQYAATRHISLGLSLQNLANGAQDTDDELPRLVRFGVGYQPINGLTLSGDVNDFEDIMVGAEYTIQLLSLRAGWIEDEPTFGAGINWRNWNFDLAMISNDDLGDSQRFSVSYAFGALRSSGTVFDAASSVQSFMDSYEKAMREGRFRDAQQVLVDVRRVGGGGPEIDAKYKRLDTVIASIEDARGDSNSDQLIRDSVWAYVEGDDRRGVLLLTYALTLEPKRPGLERLVQRAQNETGYSVPYRLTEPPTSLIDQLMTQALFEFRARQYDETLRLSEMVLVLDPNHRPAMKRQGSALYMMEQYDGAEMVWKKVQDLSSDQAEKDAMQRFIDLARQAGAGPETDLSFDEPTGVQQ